MRAWCLWQPAQAALVLASVLGTLPVLVAPTAHLPDGEIRATVGRGHAVVQPGCCFGQMGLQGNDVGADGVKAGTEPHMSCQP